MPDSRAESDVTVKSVLVSMVFLFGGAICLAMGWMGLRAARATHRTPCLSMKDARRLKENAVIELGAGTVAMVLGASMLLRKLL